jgi:hypothetical protein
MTREAREFVKSFGERLKKDLPLDQQLPFPIALMLEHLRRAETESVR